MNAVLLQLARAGVAIHVENGRLRQRSSEGAYSQELRAQVDANRPALIEALTIPSDNRARAAWLGRYARLAGIDAQALFDLIDATFGPRVLGPYALDAAETERIAAVLRTEIGKRPPIMPPAETTGESEADDNPPASIKRKREIAMNDNDFAVIAHRVLGHPGLRNADDDGHMLVEMRRRTGGNR